MSGALLATHAATTFHRGVGFLSARSFQ